MTERMAGLGRVHGTIELGESDLLDITNYLLFMEKTHIYNLGLVLGLKQTKLKALRDSDSFLDDTISAWLRKEDQVTEKGEPSWTVLVDALKHPRVGQRGIADTIAKDKGGVHVNNTNGASMELQDRNTNTANGAKARLIDVPEFQRLSSSEQDKLIVKLYEDEKNMKLQFGDLVTETRKSVEKRTSVDELAGSILALGAYEPLHEAQNRSLLEDHTDEINNADTISKIFVILNAYWNYLTYEVLEYIIKHFGDDNDKKRLISYKKDLQEFCERRIYELPPESGNVAILSPKQERFMVKLNYRKDSTFKDLLQIRGIIAQILQINSAALLLSRVDDGCVQLIFLIPKFVAQEVFPLSCEQTSALAKDASVIRLECEQFIFEGNSIHEAARQGDLDTMRRLIDEGTNVNIKDDDGVTPLHVAAERGHPRIVEYLVGKGADIDIQDKNGQTPSHLAAEKGRFENTLKYLVDKGADIDIQDKNGRTPLHIAVKEFRVKTTEFLVDNKADINSQDNDGWTPLHIAAGEGHCEDTLKYLVGKGADMNVKDNNGWAPLHIAVREFQVHAVEFLVANGADVSIKNNEGMTPLHVAAKKGESLEIVKYLICKGADINIQNNNKQTPLHIAAEDGNEYTMKELVKLGADIKIKDNGGRTPLDVAVEKGYDVIAEHFRETEENERGQKRSPSGSSVSDDSLSPTPVKKKQRHKKRRHSSPSTEQIRGASPLPQKPDDSWKQNEVDHISDPEIGQKTGRTGSSVTLKESDLSILLDLLKPVTPQWKTLGLSLGFLESELTTIEYKPSLILEGVNGYCREMLSQWLRWAPPNHPWPILEALQPALQRTGHEGLAVNLIPEFIQRLRKSVQHYQC